MKADELSSAHTSQTAAYGIFNAGFGVAWLLGSVLIGVLYDRSIAAVVLFSVMIQLAAIPILWRVQQQAR
jgi:predicted MFS family arabinose efflux permease